ncbi:hypothetical protein [Flavobacterium sp. LC2016-23]|nr:hypothetical protein [Flavobacterium sp. LC2016-23]
MEIIFTLSGAEGFLHQKGFDSAQPDTQQAIFIISQKSKEK